MLVMKSLRRGLMFCSGLAAAVGWVSPLLGAADDAKPVKPGGFVFSLFPKSLQKNPRLEFNIMTEMTAEGRKVMPPTKQNPVYYVAQAGGPFNAGVGADYDVKPPPPEKLQLMMERALAEGGYLPTDGTAIPASLAVIYHWGSHSFQPPADMEGEDADGNPIVTQAIPEVVLRKALLDRAMLLGGAKFTAEVARAMQELDQAVSQIGNPFDRLRTRSPDMERLVDELFSSSFFVVASAYDYAALAKGQRRLLWRTKMTVNALGVNMVESIPPLIASAGPYMGRETKDPVVLAKRISREGKVEVGTPTVVQDPSPTGAKPPDSSSSKR